MLTWLYAHLRRVGPAYVVLLIALTLTYLGFRRIEESNLAHDQARLDRFVATARSEIQNRITRCVDQMYSVRALYAASVSVEPNEWDAFIGTSASRHDDIGVRALCYIERVPRTVKNEFLKRRQADWGESFTISPEGERPVYYPQIYISLFGGSGQIIRGLDHGIQPERLKIMERAVDENKPLATEMVTFLAPNATSTNSGVVLYLPVYRNVAAIGNVAQRREAVQGLIYASIRTKTAFVGLLGDLTRLVDLEIYDGNTPLPNRLLYDDDDIQQAEHPEMVSYLSRRTNVVVLNRQWTIFLSTLPEFRSGIRQALPWATLLGGVSASFLLFGITLVQIKARMQAERDAINLLRSEAALAAESERLAVTLQSIADGVITTDTSGKVTSINRAGELLTGWSQSEAEGKYLGEVFRAVDGQTQEPCADPVKQVFQTKTTVEMENPTLLVALDGARRAIAASAASIRDADGNIVGAVLVFHDVTEKQKAEAQMLTESKLQSVGLLAGGIAHDFNNMLFGIMGNISVARLPDASKEEISQVLATVEKITLRAKDLTQQLLTFSRGGSPIRKPTLLPELIREACDFALHGSNVKCDYSLAGDAWPVELDEGQFRQIMNNLVINARQAMPQGGAIEVRLENIVLSANAVLPLSAGRYVKISITDQGEGIRDEHLPRIFDPYFTTKKDGTGLGLTTVYSVVRKHDGQIRVESKFGKGTTFEIFLPATEKPLDQPAALPEQGELTGRGRVLVMDDEVVIQKTVGAMLQKMGYTVETASDGQEAIQRYTDAQYAGKPFDVVIMDLTIPNGMGGREATERLRQLAPGVKAIASSGYSFDPVMANYREYGFCAVIPKPYRVEELARILKEVIDADTAFLPKSTPRPT